MNSLGFNMYSAYSRKRFLKGAKNGEIISTGWLPPLPDMRDYDTEHPTVLQMSKKLGVKSGSKEAKIPAQVDLREWCSPVENQLNLGSCTANAAVGIVEYFQRRTYGVHIEGSRLFIYKAIRKLTISEENSIIKVHYLQSSK